MFTPEWRENLRRELLEIAEKDPRIGGGAITGSASVGRLDAWSDIDLGFGVQGPVADVLADFTRRMYEQHGAVHHLDVLSEAWIYRVFLLANTLQVDLAFVPQEKFGPRAPTFKLVFGEAPFTSSPVKPELETYFGWAWLCALHVRSSLKRGKLWQAEYFLEYMRNHLISVYCRKQGLPEKEGRGVDVLPGELLKKLEPTLVGKMEVAAIHKSFSELAFLLTAEMDEKLREKLSPILYQLTSSGP